MSFFSKYFFFSSSFIVLSFLSLGKLNVKSTKKVVTRGLIQVRREEVRNFITLNCKGRESGVLIIPAFLALLAVLEFFFF